MVEKDKGKKGEEGLVCPTVKAPNPPSRTRDGASRGVRSDRQRPISRIAAYNIEKRFNRGRCQVTGKQIRRAVNALQDITLRLNLIIGASLLDLASGGK